jgi:hypothetical protein
LRDPSEKCAKKVMTVERLRVASGLAGRGLFDDFVGASDERRRLNR